MTLRRPLVLAAGVRGELSNGDQLPIDVLQLPQGYIDGLQMQWVSGTALTVTSGAAYIEGSGKVLRATADIAKTGLSLAASTWYHVYLYDNAGTPDFELSTTAPASPYNGTARSKTGDSSRRYIGSIKTNASGGIYNFFHNGQRITYGFGIIDTTARVISAGTNTTLTTVSCSVLTPVTSRLVQVRFQNLDTVGPARLSNSGTGLAPPDALVTLSPNSTSPSFLDFPTDTSQNVQYFINGSSGGQGCYLDIIGYVYER